MSQWSQPISGLQIKLLAPNKQFKIGELVLYTLLLKNVTTRYIRIFMINSEPFRFGQSTFFVYPKHEKSLITLQPSPRPHGITITEDDFHLIKPNEISEFKQSLFLNKLEFTQNGEYIVKWNYTNKIKEWPGNIKTLDGTTKQLFKGKEIPFIWIGEIETTNTINLSI